MSNKKIILTTLAPNTHRTSEENLGIEYLKACLVEKGYDVVIIDGWLQELSVEEVFDRIIAFKELLMVGISSYMSNTKSTFELIQKLKTYNPNLKIVCGGFGPTFYPKDYLQAGSDYIIRGEGEEVICTLASTIQNNESVVSIPNVGYLHNNEMILNKISCLNNELDSLPFPSRDMIDMVLSKKSSVNMLTSRGCSGNCDFCSVISFFRLADGKVWRTRSIKNIVDEIESLYKQGIYNIKMVDDSFIDGSRDEKWCQEFANEIERRNIKVRLRGQIRADKINESILKNLKRSGFFSFACGIENGSDSALRRMNKKASLQDNKKALELLNKYSYIIQMGFILFDERTTIKELDENYEFLSKFDYAVTKGIFSEMFSTEGTKMNEKLKNENKLIKNNQIYSNNKYEIQDEMVRKIYNGLKQWHKSHSYIYDMTIDPITAPKSIPTEEIMKFYACAMKLKKLDLLIYKKLLEMVKTNPEIEIQELVNTYIEETKWEYETINQKVKVLYKNNSLEYNALPNPFI